MNTQIDEHMVQVIILDISGVYAQIHDQGYFSIDDLEDIKKKYSDKQHWMLIMVD